MRRPTLAICFAGLLVLSGCLGGGIPGGETATPSAESLGDRAGVPDYPDGTENVSIRLQVGLCDGPCPSYDVELCGDGTVHYVGYRNVNVTGYRRYAVPRSNATALVNESYRSDFFAKNRSYPADGGAHSRELTVAIGNRSKTVMFTGAEYDSDVSHLKSLASEFRERTAVDRLVEGGDRDLADDRADALSGVGSRCRR